MTELSGLTRQALLVEEMSEMVKQKLQQFEAVLPTSVEGGPFTWTRVDDDGRTVLRSGDCDRVYACYRDDIGSSVMASCEFFDEPDRLCEDLRSKIDIRLTWYSEIHQRFCE